MSDLPGYQVVRAPVLYVGGVAIGYQARQPVRSQGAPRSLKVSPWRRA
jgi:hypothetical protein